MNKLLSNHIHKKAKTSYKITQIFQYICCYIIATTMPLYANDTQSTHETHKLNGIPEDNRKIQIVGHDLYMLPYFYVQVGTGIVSTQGIAQQNSAITSSTIPTFMLGVGFQQQYYISGFNFGYKIKLMYEIGVKSLGENTMAFRSGGGFFQIHLGYKYVLPYASFGYEMLSVGNNFIPSAGETILHSNKGAAFGIGSSILLSRYHALEIEFRWSKIYQNKNTPRILFAYGFRF